jgi:hypothetical protein
MRWLLVMLVFGVPVKPDRSFASLGDCLREEETIRREYLAAYDEFRAWAEKHLPAGQADGIEAVAPEDLARGLCMPEPGR